MAHHFVHNQVLDASDGIAESGSIRPSPFSGAMPAFRASTRSSTWPMATNGFHDVSFDHKEGENDGRVDHRTGFAELEASDSESIEPCEYAQVMSLQLLIRTSDVRAHRPS